MAENRALVYTGPYNVQVEDIGYPKMEAKGKSVNHGVILKVLATNICGSDLHMYRGSTDVQPGTALGHEITGVVIEKGSEVEFIELGDIVSVPFNVSCGRCRNCKEGHTQCCQSVNDLKPSGAYGYAEMGPWQGGQAEYAFVPYADFNLLKFPDRDQAMDKILDLSMLTDVFPTGMHGAVTAGVGVGKTVYIAGCGPVGLCAAVSSYMLGAACVIIGDENQGRLDHAKQILGCETINLRNYEVIRDAIAETIGVPEVDCGIDAIGFEAHGHGHTADEPAPSDALDTVIDVTRYGGTISVPGVYVTMYPKGRGKYAKMGRPPFEWGLAWDKGLTIATGQTPVMKYNRDLMTSILFNRVSLTRILGTTVISLDDAPRAYEEFNNGVAQKFVIDPHNVLTERNKMAEAVTSAGPSSLGRDAKWP